MSNRREYYFLQKVTEDELNQGFATLEVADRNAMVDLGKSGVMSGMGVAQNGVPNLTVNVGSGVAYDQLGERLSVPTTQGVNLAVDSNNVSTAVSNGNSGGNERYVSVYVEFTRALSDPRTDGNSAQVYFVENESFQFVVTAGAEAALGTATPPALMSTAILLADIHLVYNQTTILTASISSSRRQDAVVIAGSPLTIRRGRIEDALSDVVASYNNVLSGLTHFPAASIDYAGGGAWRDGTTNPAVTAEAQFDKIITDLTAQTSSHSGAEKIGSASLVSGVSGTISAGTIYSAMSALRLATNHDWAGTTAWANGTTNPAATVDAALDSIVNNLSSTSSTSGADYTGIRARSTWLDGATSTAGTLYAAVNKIITDLSAQTGSADGAQKVGLQARSAWLDGLTNVATSVYGGINKIINDLAGQGSGTAAGATKIGFFPQGLITSSNVSAALAELDTKKVGFVSLAATTTPFVSRAWGRFSCNGSGGISTVSHQGINTGSVAVSSTFCTIVFATPFADTLYAPVVSSNDGTTHRAYKTNIVDGSTVQVWVIDPVANVTINPATNVCAFVLDVKR